MVWRIPRLMFRNTKSKKYLELVCCFIFLQINLIDEINNVYRSIRTRFQQIINFAPYIATGE